MAQKRIDFGTYPNDPQADSVRGAFQKVQNNFNQLFSGASNAQVTSITVGSGLTASSPTGNVLLAANIACVQVSTSTLGIGIGTNNSTYAVLTSSAQVLTIDLPANLSGITDLTLSGNLTVGIDSNLGNTATANFFVGDGGLLTNLSVGTSSSIVNGNSNVVVEPNSNVRIGVAGNANVLVVTGTGANINGTANVTGNANVGNLSTTGLITATGNITGGNLVTSGNSSATYFIGNGSQLTGISTTSSQIFNGTSNVDIPVASGNVNTSVGGNSNVFVVTSAGAYLTGNLNIAGNVTSYNSMALGTGSGGNITGANLISANFFQGVFANGTSNVNIPVADGNVNTSVGGNSNVFVVTGTGANATGTLTATGNITGGNLITSGNATATYFIGDGSQLTGISTSSSSISNGTSNVNITVADGNVNTSVGGNSNVLIVTGTGVNVTGTLNSTGNLVSANANINTILTVASGSGGSIAGANSITANYFIGDGGLLSNISGVGSANILSNGTSNVNIPVASGNVNTSVGGVSNVFVVTSTGANLTGDLSVTSNATVSNTLTVTGGSGGQITGANLVSANFFTGVFANGTSNIAIPTASGNINLSAAGNSNILVITGTGVNVAGTLNTGSGNINANFYFGNGSQLTGISAVTSNSLANGTSNVSIPTASGNVNTSVGGTSNVLVVKSTGANITGTLDVSSNTTSGNFIGIFANGTSNVKIPTAGGNINLSAAGNSNILVITGTGANITGTANVTGNISASNANISNTVIVASGIGGNITGANYISANYFQGDGGLLSNLSATILANGTSNVSIPAVNGNINLSAAGNSNILVITGTGANITGTANVTGNISASNANISNTVIVASGIGGNITGANLINANYVSTSLYTLYSSATSISAAGSTISDATALTKQINVVNTVSLGQGVKLPVGIAGMTIYITNATANSLLVYPQVNSAINNLGANASYSLSANTTTHLIAPTTTQWYTLGAN